MTTAITDTERLDYLEECLETLSHARATNSVLMGGEKVFGSFSHPNRCRFRVRHRSIRDAIDDSLGLKEPHPDTIYREETNLMHKVTFE